MMMVISIITNTDYIHSYKNVSCNKPAVTSLSVFNSLQFFTLAAILPIGVVTYLSFQLVSYRGVP